jgi:hypothetical protein
MAAVANNAAASAAGNSRQQCCCGRSDCAYLEHNNAALEGLERDLEKAARLGQVRANIDDALLLFPCMHP